MTTDIIGGAAIKQWRMLHRVKQQTLAHMLGVSQVAVSRWENEIDKPSLTHSHQIIKLIREHGQSAVMLEKRKLSLDVGIRLMFDMDGMKLLASTQTSKSVFPIIGKLENQYLADKLVGNAAKLFNDRDLRKLIKNDDVQIINGFSSYGFLKGVHELDIKQRWSATFKNNFINQYLILSINHFPESEGLDHYRIFFKSELLSDGTEYS